MFLVPIKLGTSKFNSLLNFNRFFSPYKKELLLILVLITTKFV